jgi:hypothetical protein
MKFSSKNLNHNYSNSGKSTFNFFRNNWILTVYQNQSVIKKISEVTQTEALSPARSNTLICVTVTSWKTKHMFSTQYPYFHHYHKHNCYLLCTLINGLYCNTTCLRLPTNLKLFACHYLKVGRNSLRFTVFSDYFLSIPSNFNWWTVQLLQKYIFSCKYEIVLQRKKYYYCVSNIDMKTMHNKVK